MATKSVRLEEVEGHLAELIRAVDNGDEVVIVRPDKPELRLVSGQPKAYRRELGVYRGKIHIAEDFDAPLSDDPPMMAVSAPVQ